MIDLLIFGSDWMVVKCQSGHQFYRLPCSSLSSIDFSSMELAPEIKVNKTFCMCSLMKSMSKAYKEFFSSPFQLLGL